MAKRSRSFPWTKADARAAFSASDNRRGRINSVSRCSPAIRKLPLPHVGSSKKRASGGISSIGSRSRISCVMRREV